MKYSGIFLLLLTCAGCSASYLEGNRVQVKYLDTESEPVYDLIAVRENALIVSTIPLKVPIEADTIPFSRIDRVYHASSGFSYGVLGSGIGFVVGIGLVSEGAGLGEGSGHPNLGPAFNVLALTTVAGGFMGVLIHGGKSAYYVYKPEDLQSLREFAMEHDLSPK